jgi:hypothetical protein
MNKHLYGIERHMRGDARTLRVTRVTPSSI